MKVLVAQIGARRHYAVARAFQQAGLLARLVSDASAELAPWRWLDGLLPRRFLPDGIRRVLARRVADVPPDRISGFPWFAVSGAWERHRNEALTDFWARRNARFGRLVVSRGLAEADTVYAYNGAALEIFEAARREGRRTVLDQTAAPWRWNKRLLEDEALRWPGWEDRPAELDVSGALSEREEAEWGLADRIICGSEFARASLVETGGPAERCHVVTYPTPVYNLTPFPTVRPARRSTEPMRVLFVGTLQLRKGVQYLLQAKRLLRGEKLTFRLVGPSHLSAGAMAELRAEMEVFGPVSRSEIASHYAWADVFVLPTLSEGSANVCYEAQASGLPVITTLNAGIEAMHGEDLYRVPIRDPESLAAAVCAVRENSQRDRSVGRASMQARDFAHYAAELVEAIGAS